MATKNALRLRVSELIASAGLASVKTDKVGDGLIWCAQRIAWEIDKATSGGNTRCRLYIEGRGYNHYLAETDGPTAAALYTSVDPVWLMPGEKLALEVDQADTNTLASMYVTGYWVPLTEGMI